MRNETALPHSLVRIPKSQFRNPQFPAMSEPQMRLLVSELKPGDQIEVDQEVKVGLTRWHTQTVGEVIRTERRRHSLHYERSFDDKVWSDMIVLKRDDGELTTVAVDEFTQVKRVG